MTSNDEIIVILKKIDAKLNNDNQIKTDSQKQLDNRLTNLENDVATLKSDVAELKSDVSMLKSDVNELKSDVVEIKQNIVQINNNMQNLTAVVVHNQEINEIRSQNMNWTAGFGFSIATLTIAIVGVAATLGPTILEYFRSRRFNEEHVQNLIDKTIERRLANLQR